MLLANNKDFEKASVVIDERLGDTRNCNVRKASLVENDRHLLQENQQLQTIFTAVTKHNHQLKI